ncbi:hypothetical protein SARC_07589 [Sphaeroforma arctica JP610]|uniref:Glutathione S-transferase n=1 Tax=Sphaeroforma arctica JP610 TaxID=667725 RepID=A0A0L0FVS8_9EUKA|nr:hypothetical protein SARC_07589 [Sphaeroforma arctica JP610]KNC80043.1 hypothetical protein SARC_07589 [Sphaeroforma arctica JP610]|eukprot:XP_014153945.1 hypothetical protein SARC_07589 [Sphaeroforma arctica JP610]
MAAGRLTLYYLPIRAKAEAIKYILKYGNVDFDDVTIPWSDWGAEKEKQEICKLGQLPSIKTKDGNLYIQSNAIIRYVASLANITPTTPEGILKADEVLDVADEMHGCNFLCNGHEEGSEAFNTAKETYFTKMPNWLSASERILGDGSYFNGETPSYGDFAILHPLMLAQYLDSSLLKEYAKLDAWYAKMCSIESVKQHKAECETKTYGLPDKNCLFKNLPGNNK